MVQSIPPSKPKLLQQWGAFLEQHGEAIPIKMQIQKSSIAKQAQKNFNRRLARAVQEQNLSDMEKTLEDGADVNTLLSNRETPISYMVRSRNLNAAQLLLKYNPELIHSKRRMDLMKHCVQTQQMEMALALNRGGLPLSDVQWDDRIRGKVFESDTYCLTAINTQSAKWTTQWFKAIGLLNASDLSSFFTPNDVFMFLESLYWAGVNQSSSQLISLASELGERHQFPNSEIQNHAWNQCLSNDNPESLKILIKYGQVADFVFQTGDSLFRDDMEWNTRVTTKADETSISIGWKAVKTSSVRTLTWLLRNPSIIQKMREDLAQHPDVILFFVWNSSIPTLEILFQAGFNLEGAHDHKGNNILHRKALIHSFSKALGDTVLKFGKTDLFSQTNQAGQTPFQVTPQWGVNQLTEVQVYIEKRLLKKEVCQMQASRATVVHRSSQKRM